MRLGYISELGLAELSKRGLLDGHTMDKLQFFEHCVFGKHKRVKFNTSTHTTKGILDYVHSDLWGSSCKTSLGGACYMLDNIDDYSRKVWPHFLKHKSENQLAEQVRSQPRNTDLCGNSYGSKTQIHKGNLHYFKITGGLQTHWIYNEW
jgi:hypothetical protein